MTKTETMLIEIGALCAVFENLLQGQSKVVVQQFNTVCEMARKEITEKDKTIESQQATITELEAERDTYKATCMADDILIAQRDATITELEESNPDAAEIIELRKACKIYKANGIANRATITEQADLLTRVLETVPQTVRAKINVELDTLVDDIRAALKEKVPADSDSFIDKYEEKTDE